MKVTEEFFAKHYKEWNRDVSLTPPKSKPFSPADDPVYIDLKGYDYISLFNLMQLYLLIDMYQAYIGPTYLKIEGLEPNSEIKALEINIYNKLRKKDRRTLSGDEADALKYSEKVYKFTSFCHHFGLFSSLSVQSGQSVIIEGINEELLSQLYDYSGITKTGSRVLPMLAVREASDVEAFRVNETIDSWLNSLPQDLASAPIFLSGEFSQVFGYQLGLNIIEHSGKSWRGEYGASGLIAMRVVRPENYNQLREDLQEYSKIFELESERGILEICVGDRGNGIINSLTEAYLNYKSRYGFEDCCEPDDVLAFAFDEIGTRKELNQRIGGVHALHRILKCASKYNGLLRVVTGGKEYIYDSSLKSEFARNKYGLGIYPSSKRTLLHPYGTQFQILIPLCVPVEQRNVFVKRNPGEMSKAISARYNYKVIDVPSYICKEDDSDKIVNIGLLRQTLMEEPDSVVILYDFGKCDVGEDEVVKFLISQKAVLHAKFCIAIGVNSKNAKLLRDRELLNLKNENIDRERSDLLHILSVYHRLLLVIDTDERMWWFGLGANNFDQALNSIYESDSGMLWDDIAVGIENAEMLKLYLHANNHLIMQSFDGPAVRYQFLVKNADIMAALSSVVRLKLNEILNEFDCIEKKGIYKLPSKNLCIDRFVQSAPLMQVSSIASQISDWMSVATHEFIAEGNEVLLLTMTAPSELLAKTLSHKLIGVKVYVCNLGHTTSIDEEGLITGSDWEGVPAIIIADVIHSKTTVSKLINFTKSRNIQLLGYVSLFKMCNLKGKDPNFLFWDPHPTSGKHEIPRFFIAEYGEPKPAPFKDVKSRDNNRFFYIEPYSLESFSHNSLLGAYEAKFPKKEINRNRLMQLEEAGALRSGHWVSGSHHFKVTTCIKTILTDEIIASGICNEITQLITEKKIDLVLLPLHSHISNIINRLSTAVKLASNKNVTFTYCIMAKELSVKSFYLLPKPIKKVIYDHAKIMSTDAINGLKILLIDDAVATGRTFETILRSIILQVRKSVSAHSLKESPVSYIHSYAIIDRQGKAKSTFLTGVESINIQGDGEWSYDRSNISIPFKYTRWLDVDMPVAEKDSCELCNERYHLQTILNTSLLADDHSALHELRQRVFEIRPQSAEIPAYLNHKELRLPVSINIGQIESAETAELVLWEFNNLISRGCPFDELIGYYVAMHEDYPVLKAEEKIEQNLEALRSELIRIIFRYWSRICDQSVCGAWIQAVRPEIVLGSKVSKCVLWEAGNALSRSDEEYVGHLLYLFKLAVQSLASISDTLDKDGTRRENIGIGLILMIVAFNNKTASSNHVGKRKHVKQMHQLTDRVLKDNVNISGLSKMYLDEIKSVMTRTDKSDNFMPSLVTLLNQTIRAGRHNHDHLMPSLLSFIIKGKINVGELNLIKDMLGELNQCLEIVDRRYYQIFDDSARIVLPGFKKMLASARNELSNCDIGTITPSAISAVQRLYNHFPHQHHNSIYKCLKKTQVNITSIIDVIQVKCLNRDVPIELILGNKFDQFDLTYIIVPNEKLIEEVFSNFTVNAKISTEICPNPKMRFYFEHFQEDDSFKKVRLNIETNYDDSKEILDRILAGPGIKEANTRNIELFRIKFHAKRLNDPDYFILVQLEFCSGYPC